MRTTASVSSRRVVAALLLLVLVAASTVSMAGATSPPRVDLRLLLVANTGEEPAIQTWATTLEREGVPFDLVALSNEALPPLATGPDHALYQGVVLSNSYQPNLTDADRTRLESFEASFGLREVIAYAWRNPSLGFDYPSTSGSLEGSEWQVTPAGAATFTNLRGPVPVVDDVWGYRAQPLEGTTTLVGDADGNALIGTRVRSDGVEQLVVTVDGNASMTHAQILSHGLVTWVTGGVHLGYQRAYLAVHIDDVLLPDSRWSVEGNCTPGDDCPAGVAPTPEIRMTPADVDRAVAWQRETGLQLTMAYNGAGTADAIEESGSDQLTEALVAAKDQFAWVNHTYSHEYMGCIQDFTVIPWRCATDDKGDTLWYAKNDIIDQIKRNVEFAKTYGLPIDRRELVTGEHSGLRTLPQQPVDNPKLGEALDKAKVRYIASDASREPDSRRIDKAMTTPRHPNNIFYNVATVDELLDEYNYLYLPPDKGGKCVDTETTTCRDAPVTFRELVQIESQIMQGHLLGNDPRPTYMHQSNLAEEGVAYPVLDEVAGRYNAWFSAPLLQPTMTETTTLLRRSAAFAAALEAGQVAAYRIGEDVTVAGPDHLDVPVTAPSGTTIGSAPFGTSYGGEVSAWVEMHKDPTVLTVPASAPIAAAAPAAADGATSEQALYLQGGDTSTNSALTTNAPPAAEPEPDVDGDGHPGLTFQKSSQKLEERNPAKYQHWLYASDQDLVLDGPVQLDLWSTVADFATMKNVDVSTWLHDCAPDGTDCRLLSETRDVHVDDWNGATADWVNHTVDMGSVDAVVPAGRALRLRLMFGHEDVWVATSGAHATRLLVTVPGSDGAAA